MVATQQGSPALFNRFAEAVASLDSRFAFDSERLADEHQESEVRKWLDGDPPLPWAGPGVTADEWFFITTLYGEISTLAVQAA